MEILEKNNIYQGITDYSKILEKSRLAYTVKGNYLLIGSGPTAKVQIIYVSIILSQILPLIKVFISVFTENALSFAIIKDKDNAERILSGDLGTEHVGKVIILYLPKDESLESTLTELLALTHGFKGPEIPGQTHLAGIFYSNDYQTAPTKLNLVNHQVFQNNYLVLTSLKRDAKGDVFKCFYIKGFMQIGMCVIKEGRKFMWSDDSGRDMKDRLVWQQKVHEDLAGSIRVPKIIELFEDDENTYLAMQFIKGKSLRKVIWDTYTGRTWKELPAYKKNNLLGRLLEILEIVEVIHDKGYVHRDLSSENFLISSKNHLYVIDLELAYGLNIEYPLPPFRLGSPGYMSPEQIRMEKPTQKEDIFAIGALMFVFFTNTLTIRVDLQDHHNVRERIFSSTNCQLLADIIINCLHDSAEQRPDLAEIRTTLNRIEEKAKIIPLIINRPEKKASMYKASIFGFQINKRNALEAICYSFILLFMYAGASKLFDYSNFKVQLSKSPILTQFAPVLVWLVPLTEVAISILLMTSRSLMIGLYSSLAMMMMFTTYIIAILKFSDSIPCSCGGILQKMTWNQHLVFNLIFVLLAVVGIILQTPTNKTRTNLKPV